MAPPQGACGRGCAPVPKSSWGRGLFERSEFRSPKIRDWGKGTRRATPGRQWFWVLLPKQKDLVVRGRNPASPCFSPAVIPDPRLQTSRTGSDRGSSGLSGYATLTRPTPLKKISSQPDEQIPAQNVVETGEGDVIAGDAWTGLLAGDRRLSIEQIVDTDPKAGVVGEIPYGSQIDIMSFPEINPAGAQGFDATDVPPHEAGPQAPGRDPGDPQIVAHTRGRRAARETPFACAINRCKPCPWFKM